MTVIRVNKSKDYTVMSNAHLREKDMSLKAKGLLSVMLGLPDNWNYSIAGLVAICKENETAIKSTLNELKDFGYLVITKKMPNETASGRIEYEYNVYEQAHQKQGVENLGLEVLGVENPALLNTKQVNTKKENTKIKDIKGKPLIEPPKSSSIPAQVLEYLNAVAGTRFRQTETNLKPIKARLLENFSFADCKLVIDYKVKEWSGTEMQKYLRPETLFRPSKFEGYLNAAQTKAPTKAKQSNADTLSGRAVETAFKDLPANEQKSRLSGIVF